MKILKNDKRYIKAPKSDYNINVNLNNNKSIYYNNVREYIVNENDVYSNERDSSKTYYFHGKIEYLSFRQMDLKLSLGYCSGFLFNYGIKINKIVNGGVFMQRNIFDYDDKIFYKNNNGKEEITKVINIEPLDSGYIIYLDKLNIQIGDIITPSRVETYRIYKKVTDNFNIFKSAFSTNIYGDTIYQFICNENIIIDDNWFLNYPITSVFYRVKTYTPKESFNGIRFNNIYNSDVNFTVEGVNTNRYDIIDKGFFNFNTMLFEDGVDIINITTKYRTIEFHEQKINELGTIIEDFSYNILNIPKYSTNFMDNECFYLNIMKKSESAIGGLYDFPFLNDMHYVYTDIIVIEDDITYSQPEDEYIIDRVKSEYVKSEEDINKNRLC